MRSTPTLFPSRSFVSLLALSLLLIIDGRQGWAQVQNDGVFYSGFEQNHPTFVYGAASGYQLPSDGPSGTRSGSYAGGLAGASNGYRGSIVTSQKFTLQPGNEYMIELFAKVTNGLGTLTLIKTTGTTYQQVVSAASDPANQLVTVSISNTEHAAPISHHFTVVEAEEVHLALLFQSNNNHSVYVDDVSINASCHVQGGSVGGSAEVCGGPAPTGNLVLENYVGTVQRWQSSTNNGQSWEDIAHTEDTYTTPALTATTLYRAVVNGGNTSACEAYSLPATITVHTGEIQVAVVASATSICSGTPATFTASATNAGQFPTYQWRVNGSVMGQGSEFTSTTLRDGDQVTVRVTSQSSCNQGTTKISDPVVMTVNTSTVTVWQGFTGDWFDARNWSACVPTAQINARIPSLAPGRLAPVISSEQGVLAEVKDLEAEGAIALEGGVRLEINGAFSGAGTINGQASSAALFRGAAMQVAPGTYGELVLEGSAFDGTNLKSLTGPVVVNTSLNLAAGSLQLGNHTLTVKDGSVLSGYNSAHYILQDGNGRLQINNIGDGWSGVFPVGTAASYSPTILTNQGVLDSFSLRVVDEMRANGLQGTAYATQVVRKTWDLSEGTPGGSSVNLELQWSQEDESSGFERFQVFISQYADGAWARMPGQPRDASQVGAGRYGLSQGGVTSFSLFAVGSGETLPLPVALSRFEAQKQEHDVLLHWETAWEKNNRGFEVQVSTDGAEFRQLGFVNSKSPTSQLKQTYSFRDREEGKSGDRYYRLRQIDLDGTATLSPVRVVTFDGPLQLRVQAFPNPFREELTLEVQAPVQRDGSLQLTDALGRVVHRQEVQLLNGQNRIPIRLGDQYPAGLYLLSVQYDNGTHQVKLIKRK